MQNDLLIQITNFQLESASFKGTDGMLSLFPAQRLEVSLLAELDESNATESARSLFTAENGATSALAAWRPAFDAIAIEPYFCPNATPISLENPRAMSSGTFLSPWMPTDAQPIGEPEVVQAQYEAGNAGLAKFTFSFALPVTPANGMLAVAMARLPSESYSADGDTAGAIPLATLYREACIIEGVRVSCRSANAGPSALVSVALTNTDRNAVRIQDVVFDLSTTRMIEDCAPRVAHSRTQSRQQQRRHMVTTPPTQPLSPLGITSPQVQVTDPSGANTKEAFPPQSDPRKSKKMSVQPMFQADTALLERSLEIIPLVADATMPIVLNPGEKAEVVFRVSLRSHVAHIAESDLTSTQNLNEYVAFRGSMGAAGGGLGGQQQTRCREDEDVARMQENQRLYHLLTMPCYTDVAAAISSDGFGAAVKQLHEVRWTLLPAASQP